MSLFSTIGRTPSFLDPNPLPSVQLALDGKPIYLRNFKASVSFTREEEDMSGQKSGTEKADKGVKAKKLKVSGTIPYVDVQWLKTLMQYAEAVTEKNEKKKYRIANRTAEAVNLREGVFSGEISVTESSMQAWDVSFELSEINSVAEKKEQRAKKPKAKGGEKAGKVKAGKADREYEASNFEGLDKIGQ